MIRKKVYEHSNGGKCEKKLIKNNFVFPQVLGLMTIIVQFLIPFVVLVSCYTRIAANLYRRSNEVTTFCGFASLEKIKWDIFF